MRNILWTATSGLLLLVASHAAGAAEPLKFGQCYDLTKVCSFISPQIAQASRDLAALINANGGIGSRPIDMWAGTKWVPQSDWFADYTDLVWTTVTQHSADFAKAGK